MVDSPDINVGTHSHDDYVYDPHMEPDMVANVTAAVQYAHEHPELFDESPLRGNDGVVIFHEGFALKRFFKPDERERQSKYYSAVTPREQFRALDVLNARVQEFNHPDIRLRLSHPYYADDTLLVMERMPSDAVPLGELGTAQAYRLNDDALIAKTIGWFLLVLDEHGRHKMRQGDEFRKQLSDLDEQFALPPANPDAEVLGTPESFIIGRHGSDFELYFTTMLDLIVKHGDSGILASYRRQESLHSHVYIRLETSENQGQEARAQWEVVIIDPVATPF